MTLEGLITSIGGLATSYVADLSVFIAAGVTIALGTQLVKRFIKAGR